VKRVGSPAPRPARHIPERSRGLGILLACRRVVGLARRVLVIERRALGRRGDAIASGCHPSSRPPIIAAASKARSSTHILRGNSQITPDQPLDRGKLASAGSELGAEQLDPQIGEIALGAQQVDKLGATQPVTPLHTRPQQRLALRQQLRADQIAGLAAARRGSATKFAELALDLQLERLPACLGGNRPVPPLRAAAPNAGPTATETRRPISAR